jgi:hypothetical protein
MPNALTPWDMEYGPYWMQGRRRREVQRRALGMPETSPAVEAAEVFGYEQARRREKLVARQQQINNYYKDRAMRQAEKAASQQQLGQAVQGVGSLALGGYKLGKEMGIWGKPKGTYTISGTKGYTGPMETPLQPEGALDYIPTGEMVTSGEEALLGQEAIEASQAINFPSVPASNIVTSGEEALNAATLAGEPLMPAISPVTETAIPYAGSIISSVGEGAMGTGLAVEAGTSAATAGATAAAEAGAMAGIDAGLMTTLGPVFSVLGPVGWGLGAIGGIASLLFGDKLKEWFS